jgi:hypothetical protein
MAGQALIGLLLTIPGLPQGGNDVSAPAARPRLTDEERLELHKRRVSNALRALRDAREAYEHCPSGERQGDIDEAEEYLDGLLDDERLRREETA